jgi:hypothetical protein
MATNYLKAGDEVWLWGVVAVVDENGRLVVKVPFEGDPDYSISKKATLEAVRLDEVGKPFVEVYAEDDWKYEVANGDTKLGFAEWVDHQREMWSDPE